MKKIILLIASLFLTILVFGQDETEDSNLYPLNWFVRLSPSVFTINSTPATIDFQFLDDDFVQQDSANASFETNSMWSYGLNAEVSYLLKRNFTISHNAFFGFGANSMFTYYSQLSFGKEMVFGKFYVQPRLGISYIYSSLKIDDFYSDNKGYFEINGRYIYDDMSVKLKSRTFAASPSVLIEYPLKEFISVFGQVGGCYSFGRRSYLTFSGITDEYDSEGDAITAHENRNFDDSNINLSINNRQLLSRTSPYLHYNFNSVFVQVGIGIRLVEEYYD